MSCEDVGYFGGASTCTNDCKLDTEGCEPCAPGTAACVVAPLSKIDYAVTSGARVALGKFGGDVSIFDGTSIVMTLPMRLNGIVAVPNGWLLNTLDGLVPLASDGTLGALQPGNFSHHMTYAAHRVLVTTVIADQAYAEIRDETGAPMVPAFALPLGWKFSPQVVSDGASFFAAEGRALVRISLDGTQQAIVADLPYGELLLWANTSGWIVGHSGANHVLQHFDATGTLIDAPLPVSLGNAFAYVTDGEDLLVLSSRPSGTMMRFELVRMNPSGAVGAAELVGISDQEDVGRSTRFPMARLGNDLVVSWQDRDRTRVARTGLP